MCGNTILCKNTTAATRGRARRRVEVRRSAGRGVAVGQSGHLLDGGGWSVDVSVLSVLVRAYIPSLRRYTFPRLALSAATTSPQNAVGLVAVRASAGCLWCPLPELAAPTAGVRCGELREDVLAEPATVCERDAVQHCSFDVYASKHCDRRHIESE